jgi:bifunctional non-homologous end joining protein LigD
MGGLDTYRQKRDFGRTPEPRGGRRSRGEAVARQFVVQKHAASRLHYDFRLELDGVLKSWAVPKGPSLDPADRRLAVHTEDHPMDYGGFEGVIPEGEYGGGTVLLWDRGTWLPVGDPRKGYRTGRLSFVLEGEKLRGGWKLVRTGTGDQGKKESWLLIKEKDEAARPGAGDEALAKQPLSVASGRGLEEIAAAPGRAWRTSRGAEPPAVVGARSGPLPRSPRPQLAQRVAAAPDGDDWLHEIKYDGYRILCRLERGRARLLTRNGKDWTERLGWLAEAVAALPGERALLDGELVVLEEDGRTSFQALQNVLGRGASRTGGALYYAFDLLHLDGLNLTAAALEARKAALAELLAEAPAAATGRVRFSDHVLGQGPDFHRQACELGLEGIISKRRSSPYRAGRGRDWVKVKCLSRQEFIVVGYTDPGGSRTDLGALALGYHEGGELHYAGRVGTGFDRRALKDLRQRLEPLRVTQKPVGRTASAEARGVRWVRPELVVEVAFTGWTDDGRLRHPTYQGLREDVPASGVVRERVAAPPPRGTPETSKQAGNMTKATKATAASAAPSPGRRGNRPVQVAGVRITNPDRVVYPEQGVTKLELARYYEAAAALALPHLGERPLTLLRCPSGRERQCFFQKHAGAAMAAAVRRVHLREEAGEEPYMYVDGVEALLALVQVGVLEFHVWGSRVDRLDRPDRLVFDLDPDEGLPWQRVVAAAFRVRDRLAELGLESFAKTTGGKGLHVVVPVARRVDWEVTKAFTQGVAEDIVRAAPAEYTARMAKTRRKGRVFVDYLRNAWNATAVGAYSTRARPGAPVSVPVSWAELEAGLNPAAYTVRTAPEWLSGRADPWPGFSGVRQSITVAMRRELGLL